LHNTTFGNVVSSSPFFTATATYDYGVSPPIFDPNVSLTLTFNGFAAAPGQTKNELAVGQFLNTVYSPGVTGDAATFFSNLFAATSLNALDQLSGEGTAAAQNTAFSAGNMFMNALADQFELWLSGERPGVPDGGTLGYAAEPRKAAAFQAMAKAAPAYIPSWHVWASGFGGSQSFKGDAGAGSSDAHDLTAGGILGVDYAASPELLLGFGSGGSTSHFSVSSLSTNGDVDGGHVGFYGMQRWGAAYAKALIGYGHFDNRTTRTITGVGPTETATGSFTSDQLGGRLELGRNWNFGKYGLTPFAAVQVSELWQRGYSETSTVAGGGPGVLGLNFAPVAVTSLPTFVGAQFDTRVALPNGDVWLPFARASWVHEFRPTRAITASFVSVPGGSFTVDGARPASDSVKLDLGARVALNSRMMATAAFTGEFSDRSQSYAGRAGVNTSF
jgi:outer membrane autotransporter protein